MTEVGEAEILEACRVGAVLECGDGSGRRPVDAGLLRRYCDDLSAQVHRHGVRLRQADIVGFLDLSGLDVGFPLVFEDCEFDSPLGHFLRHHLHPPGSTIGPAVSQHHSESPRHCQPGAHHRRCMRRRPGPVLQSSSVRH